MILTEIGTALFGEKGLVGGLISGLQSVGVLPDAAAQSRAATVINDFALKLGQQVEDQVKIEAEDRANARLREIQVKDKTPMYLGVFSVLGFFGILSAMMFYPIPESAHDIIVLMVGFLGGMVVSVYQYYYGSSTGSKSKDDVIAAAMKGK